MRFSVSSYSIFTIAFVLWLFPISSHAEDVNSFNDGVLMGDMLARQQMGAGSQQDALQREMQGMEQAQMHDRLTTSNALMQQQREDSAREIKELREEVSEQRQQIEELQQKLQERGE